MKTHRWMSHVVMQPQTYTAEGSPEALRTDPLVRAARGAVILTLVLGGLGAAEAEALGSSGASHAGAHQTVGNMHHAAKTHLNNFQGVTNRPWMY